MPRPGRRVDFTVTLYLPETEKGTVLDVKNFETDMPLFAHRIGDLVDGVHFHSISLRAENFPIDVKSLHATKAQAVTQNSQITGTYNVTSSLEPLTSNGNIDVVVNLHDEDIAGLAEVKMHTANGPIHANVNLASKETGGNFAVAASTQNSPINIDFLSAPVDSALSLSAHTSIAPVGVKLHETYQGAFKLRTSLSRARVIQNQERTDPAGKGRKRKVTGVDGPSRSSASGTAVWSDEGLELGTVDLESSLAPVSLVL